MTTIFLSLDLMFSLSFYTAYVYVLVKKCEVDGIMYQVFKGYNRQSFFNSTQVEGIVGFII